VHVGAFKPVVTGLDEQGPYDHELLAACTGQAAADVAPLTFGPAVSPHLAAALTGTPIDPEGLLDAARRAAAACDVLVAEGVGGLLVPLTDGYSVRDFAVALGLPVVIAARAGLGTINHTLLTVESARGAGLDVRAVVLGPWPQAPTAIERSNAETIAALGAVAVYTLARVALEPAALARAGAALPLADFFRERR